MNAISRQQALAKLWELGRIEEIKLHSGQMEVLKRFRDSDERTFVLNSARRWGKSTLLLVIALTQAIRHPGSLIRYAASSAYQVRRFTTPLLRELLVDCPIPLRPVYRAQDKTWVFKNGSEIHIAGVDNGRAESLRGTSMHLGIIDEAAFIDDLPYLVRSILMPQMLTTGGRLLISSTPNPKQLDHPFWDFVDEAEEVGAYATNTIYENPLLSEEQVQDAIKSAGGVNTTAFKAEYLAQRIMDTEHVVVPEFHQEAQERIVVPVERPAYFDAYVGLDLGYIDATAGVFGYLDFGNNKLVIEDEIVLTKPTTEQIAHAIMSRESELWGAKRPYLRYCDLDLRAQADLASKYDLHFNISPKEDKAAAINTLRLMLSSDRIRIHPRCTKLISQLAQVSWNKNRTDFRRTPKHGHYDLVDALIFLTRNVDFNRNPAPDPFANSRNDDKYFYSLPKRPRPGGLEGLFSYAYSSSKYDIR